MTLKLVHIIIGLEPRVLTRWDVQKYAREAYNLGIRYIGGCCGFEPYHIRAIAEELAPERGFLPEASEKHGSWGSGLSMHTKPWVRARCVYIFFYLFFNYSIKMTLCLHCTVVPVGLYKKKYVDL